MKFERSRAWSMYSDERFKDIVRVLIRGAFWCTLEGRPLCPQSPLHLLTHDALDEVIAWLDCAKVHYWFIM